MTFGFYLARALTRSTSPAKFPLDVRPEGARHVSVEATSHTTVPGIWGIWLSDGGHLQVAGTPIAHGGRVRWQLAVGHASLTERKRGRWTGIAHSDPLAAGLRATDELVSTGSGMIPSWMINTSEDRRERVWAVHIHGAGSSRAGTLRGVLAASQAGLPSLVMAYRNTAEGPRVGRGRSHLGLTESADVADALGYLTNLGAERFLLFGWSMGAQVILPVAASASWRGAIAGIVLDSPVLNWQNALAHSLASARLPPRAARLAPAWLKGALRSHMVGLDERVDLRLMDWLRRSNEIAAPVLIHHGTFDMSVPIDDSRKFIDDGGRRQLVEFAAGHTVGWNVDPARWGSLTAGFARSHSL